MKTIMIIDDDMHIGNMLEDTLKTEGYGILRAYSGTEALMVLEREKPDLILLDLMLPGLSGEELLKKINGIPVIIVSAKIDIDNKVALLLDGACDYITKPFEMKELLARIAVQFRINSQSDSSYIMYFKDLKLNTDINVATVNNKDVKLTRTESAILKLLMKNPERVITKTAILDCIAMDTPDCTESSLKQHISNLRKKLKQVTDEEYIEAIWGIGFKMKND